MTNQEEDNLRQAQCAGAKEAAQLFGDVDQLDKNPNFAILSDKDEYGQYFRLLRLAFGTLAKWYEKLGADFEAKTISAGLTRLLFTAEALRLKYTYDLEHFLKVDLTESGFPNYLELDAVRNDFQRKDELLPTMASLANLKRMLLDHLFKYREESAELLYRLSERSYLMSLSAEKIFFPFTPGELTRQKAYTQSGARQYVFTWYTFDFRTNLPFVYIMTFEQDEREEPLENRGKAWAEFYEAVVAEGARAPLLKTVAESIDDRLFGIHPKAMKRICLGPIYAGFLMDNYQDSSDPWQQAFMSLIEKSGNVDGFVMLLTDEILFSQGEEKIGRLFNARIKQIFHIPENDLECYNRGISVVHRYALLPHSLWQEAANDETLKQLGFANFKPLTFNGEGIING